MSWEEELIARREERVVLFRPKAGLAFETGSKHNNTRSAKARLCHDTCSRYELIQTHQQLILKPVL